MPLYPSWNRSLSLNIHRFAMFIVGGLGMLTGFVCLALFVWSANILGLPQPSNRAVGGIIMYLVLLCLFLGGVPLSGMAAILIVQKWLPAKCPTCGEKTLRIVFETVDRGTYLCNRCGSRFALK